MINESPPTRFRRLLLPFQAASVGGDSSFLGKGEIVSQPQQQPLEQQPQQPAPVQQPEQNRAPVVVHAPDNSGQLAQEFASFRNDMLNTLRGLPEQLVNSMREATPQPQPQPTQQPQQPQTAQQAQTQQHTQQPQTAQQQSQQSAATRAPFRERFQRGWFGWSQ